MSCFQFDGVGFCLVGDAVWYYLNRRDGPLVVGCERHIRQPEIAAGKASIFARLVGGFRRRNRYEQSGVREEVGNAFLGYARLIGGHLGLGFHPGGCCGSHQGKDRDYSGSHTHWVRSYGLMSE